MSKQIHMTGHNKFLGVQSIADNLGVNREAVYAWLQRHGPESESTTPVPQPDVAIEQGTKQNTRYVYGWAPSSVSEWRTWFAVFKDMTELEAAHYWVDVDSLMKERSKRRG